MLSRKAIIAIIIVLVIIAIIIATVFIGIHFSGKGKHENSKNTSNNTTMRANNIKILSEVLNKKFLVASGNSTDESDIGIRVGATLELIMKEGQDMPTLIISPPSTASTNAAISITNLSVQSMNGIDYYTLIIHAMHSVQISHSHVGGRSSWRVYEFGQRGPLLEQFEIICGMTVVAPATAGAT